MEKDNKNTEQNNPSTNQFGSGSAKEKQREYNENLENQSDTQLNDSASRTNTQPADPSSKDVATDNGYKQSEAEEMSGEVTRKSREENLEKGQDEGGAKDSHGVTINEAEHFDDENTITENTKERATLSLTGRSVV